MIVLGGCILSMLTFFVAANKRAQRLSENALRTLGFAERYRSDRRHAQRGWGLRWRLVQRLDPMVAISPSQRPRACSGLRPNAIWQRSRACNSHPARLGRKRGYLRH